MVRSIYVILFLCIGALAFGQHSDEELAGQFYSQGDYEKAAVLYKKIIKDQPRSVYIYDNYLHCLIALEQQKKATSLVKQQIRRDGRSMKYRVDLGYVYEQFDKTEKSKSYFEKLIKEQVQDQFAISQLAQAFMRREYISYAIQCFEDAIAAHGLNYYWMSLINLYRSTGDYKHAVDLGMQVVLKQRKQLNTLSYQFSKFSEEPAAADYLQQQLLVYSQKYPNKAQFDELLMNLYLQRKKYKAAFRQARAIDQRKGEKGERVLKLAQLCVNNEAYEVAEQCYQYLMDKGPNSLYYIDGRVGQLNTAYLRITGSYSQRSGLQELIHNYETFLTDFGYSRGTASSMKRLSELYLFHTKETDKAISILNELIQLPRLNPLFVGESKLLLGDAYLIQGAVWDARLLYGQVDKDFKEDALGREAKFRNARLAYFTGDFEWAKNQLSILKMATTQLIANNALDLDLLIQDNTGLDSTEEAMKEYAHAEFLLFQNRYEDCMEILNFLPFKYGGHSLEDEVMYLKGKVKEKQGRYSEALVFYQQVYDGHSGDILADNALFRSAEIYYGVLANPTAASALYERIIMEHTASLYVIEARKKFEEIRNIQLQ